MKFYISTTGIKRVNISNSSGGEVGKVSAAHRRVSIRTLLPVVVVLGILLPFFFVRVAFLVLESTAVDCLGWRYFGGMDTSKHFNFFVKAETKLQLGMEKNKAAYIDLMKEVLLLIEVGLIAVDDRPTALDVIPRQHGFTGLTLRMEKRLRQELTRALVEVNEGSNNDLVTQKEGPINSFSELVKEMTSRRQDIKGFTLRTKAMLADMEHKVRSARQRELVFWHFASHGVPKSLHCLCLKLTEEYAVNAKARSRLPPPEFMSRLTDPSFCHIVLLTDNVLAASVVVSSTLKNSVNPEKLVFHVVTDKKTYTSMHAWFSINPIRSAVVEVKGLHQFDWSRKVNVGVKEMLEIHHLIWSHYYDKLKEDLQHELVLVRSLEVLSPSYLSLLNHLRIYIPELFPDLDKIVFLDDDVVVQKDITPLWDLHLNEKVAGAVVGSWCGENCCPGRKYRDYFNFSHPTISFNLDSDRCAWLYGMIVFDLDAWRRSNITRNYHRWLKQSLNSGLELWQPGVLPPALLAFEGHVHPIEPLWLMSGLGQNPLNASMEKLEDAAILHYSGPAKPWLEISFPEIRIPWSRHVNSSNKFIRTCRITG